ncbi:MAG: cyclic pyranopterin monophosphate synthase MoaC [Acidobacteriota bacterium]|nr:cyclic pyranopterin monophosphate synthase MoaC [Acidobacteriota bacterium]MDQ7088355.1 cyclic pyranopterin monophosphate synthase MoaC [Acidobacteriota bacterium]
MNDLSHIDGSGAARMVDVGDKPPSPRRAEAEAWLEVGEKVMAALADGATPKGNVFETARLAGIMAAKKTADLIPLCHDLPLDHVAVDFERVGTRIRVRASAATRWSTGVEMEALTAAAVAGLTLYDMLKALSKTMTLDGLRLLSKSGGRSGEYRAEEAP